MKLFLLIFASSFIFVSMKKTTTKRPKTTTKRTTTKRPSGTLRCFDCNSYDDNCGDFDESSSGSWETCSRSDYCIKQTMTNPEDGKKYSEHACAQSLWFGAENGGKYHLNSISAQIFNSVLLKITIFQMITVTGKEMVVTRRRTRWMRTVLQSRTTRFAAATPTCKLHGLLFSPLRPVCRHTSLFQVQQLGGRSGLCGGTSCSRHGHAALLMFILPWYQSQCEKSCWWIK